MTATVAALAVTAQPAQAGISAKVSVATTADSARIVVVLRSSKAVPRRARPKAVSVVANGQKYRLSRARATAAAVRLGTWRSKAFTGAAAETVKAIAGTAVKVKLRSRAGKRSLSTQVAGGAAPGGDPQPPAGVAPPPPGPQPLFPPPAAPSTGNQAYEAIKGYFADSRFTDCPAMWPNCAVEQRYSHFPNGDQYYCRLTPTSGSDINSYGQILQISGAEQNADGSWGVEYYLSSYGNTTFYSWRVAADGTVTGQYWGPGQSPATGPANEQITGLLWVRGALDCSY
jgi:hypothetical protein